MVRTTRISNKTKAKFIIYGGIVLLIVCIIATSALLRFVNEQTMRHTIMSIDKVEKTSGDKDGFTTKVYYIVTTDKGIYHIETSGFNAHPECAGMKKDSTYLLTTRGLNFPFIGRYPDVIHYQKVNQ